MTGRVVGEPAVMRSCASRLRALWPDVDDAADALAATVHHAGLGQEALSAVGEVVGVAGSLEALADALVQADSTLVDGVADVADTSAFAAAYDELSQAQVMTFNIGRGAVGPEGAEQDQLDQVAAAIAANGGVDVAALQEIHEDDIPILLEILETEYGLVYDVEFTETVTAEEMQAMLDAAVASGDEDRAAHLRDRISGYGIATLSRAPISSFEEHTVPDDGREPRAAQEVVTNVGGEDVTIVNTHLTTDDDRTLGDVLTGTPSAQDEQTATLFDIATGVDGPVIVTGDLNQDPGELADNAKDYELDGRIDVANDRDEGTHGTKVIDYVLTSPDVGVGDADVLDDVEVSDHQPVVVDVDIPG